jgi:dephospho-CoA kinase
MVYVVGLTGGIGSGKTEVEWAFAALGVAVADADAAAHAVTARGTPGHDAVIAAFGLHARGPGGDLDRAWLRRTVFADVEARRRLERLLHPLILERLMAEMAAWKGAYGLVSVPLLLERGNLLPLVSRVLVVDCPEEMQVQRVTARSGMAAEEVRAIMATQVSRAERLARADDVIDNSGTLDALLRQVAQLDARYRERARALEPAGGSPDNGARTQGVE